MLTPFDRLTIRRTFDDKSKTERQVYLRYAEDTLPDVNWESFDDTAIDVSDDTNDGRVKNVQYRTYLTRVMVDWTKGRKYIPFHGNAGETMADVLIYIRPAQLSMFERLSAHEGSHVLIDGHKLKPIKITPIEVEGVAQYLVESDLYLEEGT